MNSLPNDIKYINFIKKLIENEKINKNLNNIYNIPANSKQQSKYLKEKLIKIKNKNYTIIDTKIDIIKSILKDLNF